MVFKFIYQRIQTRQDHSWSSSLRKRITRLFWRKDVFLSSDFTSSSVQLAILIDNFDRSVYEFYARGTTYDRVHEVNRSNKHLWEKYIPDTSFKFTVSGFNHTIPQRRQRDVIESFSYMDFRGKIDMKNPEITIGCFEECRSYLPSLFVKVSDSAPLS